MSYTEYLFDREMVKDLVAERTKTLQANRGASTKLLPFGLGVVMYRLGQDRRRYRDYGPYWWALKEALKKGGYNLGEHSDTLIRQVYRGDSDEETMIMADEFRTDYLKRNIIYTNRFILDADSQDFWELYDPDMEFPAA